MERSAGPGRRACSASSRRAAPTCRSIPDYPAERLAFMLRDTAVRILLTRAAHPAQLPAFDGHVICLDRDAADIDAQRRRQSAAGRHGRLARLRHLHVGLDRRAERRDGAASRHRPPRLPHQLHRARRERRVAHLSNPSFDAATFEIWGALLNGARLVVLRREVALDPPPARSRACAATASRCCS